MEKMPEKKFIPVMLTPFKNDSSIDFDGLTRLTEVYLHAGVQGLFANCQSSEMYELSDDEKLQVVNHVMKITGRSVPVVAVGNFGKTITAQAAFMNRIYETGAEAVIIVTSLIAKANEEPHIFEERIFQLFDLTEKIPLGFYECPEPYKRLLTPKQLEKFVATGRVIYHKDTCLDIALVREKLKATHAWPSFGLYDAYAVNAVDSLKAGAAGLSCIQGNFFPELIVWLCEHYDDIANKEEVNKVQEFLRENMEVVHTSYPMAA
ncbi:MAG: dihydrodipicolinate synthase family protein, partial [Bacteroidota bacterium]|nr:dihydrodipicolinate synthase family protein [Bacteroidota bacterium]